MPKDIRQLLLRRIGPFRNPRFYEWFFTKTPLATLRARDEEVIFGSLGKVIKPDHSVLEVGPGPGNYTVPVAHRCKDMVAIDPSPKMLQYLRKRLTREGLTNVETRPGRLPDGLEAPKKFDGVLTISVLLYLEEIEESLRALASTLKPGGWAIFNVALDTTEGRIYNALTGPVSGRRKNLLSLEETIDFAEKAGLRVQETTPTGFSRGGLTLVVRAVA